MTEQVLAQIWVSNVMIFTHASTTVRSVSEFKTQFAADDYRPTWEAAGVSCLRSLEVLVPSPLDHCIDRTPERLGERILARWEQTGMWQNGVNLPTVDPVKIHNSVLMWCLDVRYRQLGMRDHFYQELQSLIDIKQRYTEDIENVLISLQMKMSAQRETNSQTVVSTYHEKHKQVARAFNRSYKEHHEAAKKHLQQTVHHLVCDRHHVSWYPSLQMRKEMSKPLSSL